MPVPYPKKVYFRDGTWKRVSSPEEQMLYPESAESPAGPWAEIPKPRRGRPPRIVASIENVSDDEGVDADSGKGLTGDDRENNY